jgi:hypothetical protein
MTAVFRLSIVKGIEVDVVEDANVRSSQIYSPAKQSIQKVSIVWNRCISATETLLHLHATRPRRQKEDRDRIILVESINERLSLGNLCAPVQTKALQTQ